MLPTWTQSVIVRIENGVSTYMQNIIVLLKKAYLFIVFRVNGISGTTARYTYLLRLLIQKKKQIKIVVIGANDGKTNDPIYSFNMDNISNVKCLLIEPQPDLIDQIRINYKDHENIVTVNKAVSQKGVLHLFRIKKKFWATIDKRAKKNPGHTIASGITSASKSHVIRHVNIEFSNPPSVDDYIEEIKVDSLPLIDILSDVNWGNSIDVLQVDAEGYDDEIILSSNLDVLAPKIVYFESKMLDAQRMSNLKNHLNSLGYILISRKSNSIALKTAFI